MRCSPPTRNTIADTVQWFEFHNSAANLSVFVIRGTASATDVVKDFDIWNEVALPQLLTSILRECAALHALGGSKLLQCRRSHSHPGSLWLLP